MIRNWAPWTASTGPRTPKGKQVSSKNAVNYSLRAVMREIALQNRTLIGFIKGTGSAPTFDRTVIDGLLDDLEGAAGAIPSRAEVSRAADVGC